VAPGQNKEEITDGIKAPPRPILAQGLDLPLSNFYRLVPIRYWVRAHFTLSA